MNAKAAGYTHKISWKEYNDVFDLFVEKSFPTTKDAVNIHLRDLRKRQSATNDDSIVDIKVVEL